jgi:polyisoprenoid-binding protein YceI
MKRLVASLLSCLVATSAWATDYKIDPAHSSVSFKVRHMGISYVPGRFMSVDGTFSYDPTNVKNSKAAATIAVSSLNTADVKRDDHLKSPEFLDAAKFKDIAFKTTSIEPVSADAFKAKGDLSIHGVTKPVVLDVTYGGSGKDPWGNERAAFTATTKINRKDFGLTWSKVLETGQLLVGEDVQIVLEIEGIKA